MITPYNSTTTSSTNNNGQCVISFGSYEGEIYTKPNETVDNKCLIESPWMRVAQHSVKLLLDNGGNNNNNSNNKIVSDWLYIDYHDRINVLVEAPSVENAQPGEEQQFIILKQTKYALNDEVPSYAIVGGIIEPNTNSNEEEGGGGETPDMAAKREVQEELNVKCSTWHKLGKFRTDVNRGMGWVRWFLVPSLVHIWFVL